jgi:hypothetical protein
VSESSRDGFGERRRKEQLAFLVVKFLKAYLAFQAIHASFREAVVGGRLAESGIYEKVRDLENTLAFDLKELAHALFRTGTVRDDGKPKPAGRISRRMLRELTAAIEMRSIDSYIGTGYHLLTILRESLYQLRQYAPEYEREKEEVAAIEDMARRLKYTFSPEEARELEHLRSLAERSMKLSAENESLSRRIIARCRDLFQGTAQVILRNLESAAENEVLVQNLLQNRGLLEKVYGAGAAEGIFRELCRGRDLVGSTGLERARSYVRKYCGNVDGLNAPGEQRAPAASPPASRSSPAAG